MMQTYASIYANSIKQLNNVKHFLSFSLKCCFDFLIPRHQCSIFYMFLQMFYNLFAIILCFGGQAMPGMLQPCPITFV